MSHPVALPGRRIARAVALAVVVVVGAGALAHAQSPSLPATDPCALLTDQEVLERLAASPPQNRGDMWHVRLPDPEAVRKAIDAVRSTSATVESLTPMRASLEERFLAHVSESGSLDE